MSQFIRSFPAQAASLVVVEIARSVGLLKGALVVDEALAVAEKELFLKMLSRIDERRRGKYQELSPDEISSLFTFVFARAAEAVTDLVNHRPSKFEMDGMLDGRIPLGADERLTGYFKTLSFPDDCACAYLDWYGSEEVGVMLRGIDPILPLFEALKWTFRISCHIAVEKLEMSGVGF